MVFLTFGDGCGEVLELTAFCCCGACTLCLDFICTALHAIDVREEVLLTYQLCGMPSHTMAVCEYLECTLLGTEQPVDRPVLVHLLVVVPEILEEILLKRLAEAVLNVVEVGGIAVLTEYLLDELTDSKECVVCESAV